MSPKRSSITANRVLRLTNICGFHQVILLLLGSCQVELLESDGLEGAVEVMKTSLAPFAEQNVEWLVSQVLSFDISKDLESYEVSCLS